MSEHRTSTILLLLTTGGVIYLLYKRRSADDDEEDLENIMGSSRIRRSQNSHQHKARWRSRGGSGGGSGSSWLGWLFGGRQDNLLDDMDATFIVKGTYFGPSPRSAAPNSTPHSLAKNVPHSKTVSLNEALNTTYDPSFLAPCPNCIRGTCRIKRHRDLNMSSSSTTSCSSLANSPMHSKPFLLPPTSTPESADDELSESEFEAGKGGKFHSR